MSSPLLNRGIVTRALKDVLQGLAERRLTQRFVDLANDFTVPVSLCEFPSFTLFTPGKKYPPYKWFLPKPFNSIQKFLAVYEELVQHAPTMTGKPGAIAAKAYPWASSKAEFIRSFRNENDWRSAATLLVATAQWLGAEIEVADENLTQARLGPSLLEVSARGCWSNDWRRTLRPCGPAEPTWPVTAFPATQTSNNYLRALDTLRESLDANLQYAGTVLAAALNQRVVTPDWLREAVADALIRSRVQKVKLSSKVERASAALVQCSDVLDRVEVDLVPELYEAAVPGLMSSRKFRTLFGVPTQVKEGRETNLATRQRWQQVLDQVFEEIQDANA